MDARPVSPTDQTREVGDPEYRVFFWSRPTVPRGMWTSDEWELSNAEVPEVLEWAELHRAGRVASVWAVIPNDDGVTHIRLLGRDPLI